MDMADQAQDSDLSRDCVQLVPEEFALFIASALEAMKSFTDAIAGQD